MYPKEEKSKVVWEMVLPGMFRIFSTVLKVSKLKHKPSPDMQKTNFQFPVDHISTYKIKNII